MFSFTASSALLFIMGISLLRLNQLPDFLVLSSGLDWCEDAVVEATLGDDARSTLAEYGLGVC